MSGRAAVLFASTSSLTRHPPARPAAHLHGMLSNMLSVASQTPKLKCAVSAFSHIGMR